MEPLWDTTSRAGWPRCALAKPFAGAGSGPRRRELRFQLGLSFRPRADRRGGGGRAEPGVPGEPARQPLDRNPWMATSAQQEALLAAFTGKAGGPLATWPGWSARWWPSIGRRSSSTSTRALAPSGSAAAGRARCKVSDPATGTRRKLSIARCRRRRLLHRGGDDADHDQRISCRLGGHEVAGLINHVPGRSHHGAVPGRYGERRHSRRLAWRRCDNGIR